MRAQLAEALDDSAIRISLVARLDDTVVGYLMARTDLATSPHRAGGDHRHHWCRSEYAHRGVGHALMSQLFVNLGAANASERVETIVAPRDTALTGFLYDCGFAPFAAAGVRAPGVD